VKFVVERNEFQIRIGYWSTIIVFPLFFFLEGDLPNGSSIKEVSPQAKFG